jgi:hypothetical protein
MKTKTKTFFTLALAGVMVRKHVHSCRPTIHTRAIGSGAGFPKDGSPNGEVQQNADGSTDIYFGPKAPAGKKANGIQTVPGRGWCTILRLYSPLQSWFDKTWRPGEIERVSGS